MPTGLVARAFERAVQTHRPAPGLLHHSDRGSHYASDAYRDLLRRHGAIPSMSRAGNCDDHARMENFWAPLKGELIGEHVFATRAEAKSEIFRSIEIFYNRVRLHGALGFQSPVDFENNLSQNTAIRTLRPVRENAARCGSSKQQSVDHYPILLQVCSAENLIISPEIIIVRHPPGARRF